MISCEHVWKLARCYCSQSEGEMISCDLLCGFTQLLYDVHVMSNVVRNSLTLRVVCRPEMSNSLLAQLSSSQLDHLNLSGKSVRCLS